MFKRISAMILSLCMLLSMVPAPIAHAEATGHSEDCYLVVTACTHLHEDCGYVFAPGESFSQDACGHVCSEATGCVKKFLTCTLNHDEPEPLPCEHSYAEGICTLCGAEDPDKPLLSEKLSVLEWSWVDAENLVDGELALPGASIHNIARFEDIVSLLPTAVSTEYGVLSVTWSCAAFPAEGAYEGEYSFTAALPEGYALAEGAAALAVPVVLGGAEMYDTYTGSCGTNVKWTFDSVTGVLTISGTGAMKDYDVYNLPQYLYDHNIKSVVVSSGVTHIGNYAFGARNKQITEVSISDTVTSIGDNAFYACSNLSSLTLPNNLETIGKAAFYECTSISSLSLPSSLTSIGAAAFASCSNITSLSLPSGITSIGDRVFMYCNGLKSISIPINVTSIGEEAFGYCGSLTDISFSHGSADSLSIGNNAFAGYTSQTLDTTVEVSNADDLNSAISGYKWQDSHRNVTYKSAQAATTLSGISVSTKPAKTVYGVGEVFDPTGMVVTATYSDGSSKQISGFTFSPEGGLKETDTAVTISYAEGDITQTASLPVSVEWRLYINEENFPDANFRAYIDTLEHENEGYFTRDEVEAVTKIHCANSGISSLKGIEHFTGLTWLECQKNSLTSLDLSRNTKLKDLSCFDNSQLTELKLENNLQLSYLSCGNTGITSLDVSKNTALTALYCADNALTGLDISNNTGLEELGVENTGLTELDLSRHRALEYLDCSDNKLSSLTLTDKPNLYYLDCCNNNLAVLDLSGINSLTQLYCDGQSVKASAEWDSGNCIVRMADVVNNNTGKVSHVVDEKYSYVLSSGIMTLTEPPAVGGDVELKYYYGTSRGGSAPYGDDGYMLVTLTVTVPEKPAVATTLSSISVSTKPSKTVYGIGEVFDPAGMVITATYSDGSSKEVSGFTFSPEGGLKENDTAVTISYTEGGITQTASLPVSVEWRLYINEENFPDANFRAYVAGLNHAAEAYFTRAEVMAVKELDCSYKNIKDLTGIEYFTELTALSCSGNELTALDVSNNTKLVTLHCSSNKLSSLNVNGCTMLEVLTCFNSSYGNQNQLTSLELSSCTGLSRLDVSGNLLTSLDLSNNKALNSLSCSNNQLSALNVSHLTALVDLNCSNNQLSTLDVSALKNLEALYCVGNQLSTLDVSNLAKLDRLACTANQLVSIKLDGCTKLLALECGNNKLSSIDLSACAKLRKLYCSNNQLPMLDLEGSTSLVDDYTVGTYKGVSINDQHISLTAEKADGVYTIDMNKLLGKDYISRVKVFTGGKLDPATGIVTLDTSEGVSQGSLFYTFETGFEKDPELNVYAAITLVEPEDYVLINEENFPDANFRAFVSENFDKNKDDKLSRAELDAVSEINCREKKIADLTGIAYFTKLERLDCSKNSITALDLRHNVILRELSCEGYYFEENRTFKSLDVRGLLLLNSIDCSSNLIESLDLSTNISLTELNCNYNKLTELDLSACPILNLSCMYNQISSLKFDKFGYDAVDSSANLNCKNNRLAMLDLSSYHTHRSNRYADQSIDLTAKHDDKGYYLDLADVVGKDYLGWLSNITGGSYDADSETGRLDLDIADGAAETTVTYNFKVSGPSMNAVMNVTATVKIPPVYSVTVNGGEGSGKYLEKTEVSIRAAAPEAGKMFSGWSGADELSFTKGDKNSPEASFTMPAENVELSAVYEDILLTGISITTQPTKTLYFEGESFEPSGMVVTAEYSDGSSKEVSGFTFSPDGALSTADSSITISYTEANITKTADVSITVNPILLSGISITTQPAKTLYFEGESFDPSGMVVTAEYSDGSSKEVSGFTFSPDGALSTADSSITVSYTEANITKSADVSITVNPILLTGISITTQPRLEYNEGDALDLSALVVKADYNNGSSDTLFCDSEGISLSIANGSLLSKAQHDGKTITVSFGGMSAVSDALNVKSTSTEVKSIKLADTEAELKDGKFFVTLPAGTDLSKLSASDFDIELTDSAAVHDTPASTDGGKTWSFSVTAENGAVSSFTVNVTVAINQDELDLEAAKNNILKHIWTLKQSEANDMDGLKKWLENELKTLDLVGAEVSGITIDKLSPAAEGSKEDKDGSNGSFTFTVKLSKGSSSLSVTVSSGSIIATGYTEPARSGKCGPNAYWELDEKGNLRIYGEGEVTIAPWLEHFRDEIISLEVGEDITAIPELAFDGCSELKEIQFTGKAPYIADNAFRNVTATARYPVSPSWTKDKLKDYGGKLTWVGVLSDYVEIPFPWAEPGDPVCFNGENYSVSPSSTLILPRGEEGFISFAISNGASTAHGRYPVGLEVFELKYVDGNPRIKADVFDDILQYSGSSIRVTGKNGIRMITSVPGMLKTQLISSGVDGYTLQEYGTVVGWASELGGAEPTLDNPVAKSNYAYRKGVADPVFAYSGNLIQYTNVLVNFTDEQCKHDLVMRPYVILRNSEGKDFTIYGGSVQRSIGYIAYQNRSVFRAGSTEYEYIWNIIHAVYGNKYDSEYKTK